VTSVLVIAAHPDDEVLGCGGTIARHAAQGDRVDVVIAGEGVMARSGAARSDLEDLREAARRANGVLGARSLALHDFPDNKLDSVAMLDITRFVEEHVQKNGPEIVYTHHWSDLNSDHTRLSECVLTACRPTPGQTVRRILCFEIPSSTSWRGPRSNSFDPDWFVDISDTLSTKVSALNEYAHEMREFPHARSQEAITHLARWRGASVGILAAEAFVLVRNLET